MMPEVLILIASLLGLLLLALGLRRLWQRRLVGAGIHGAGGALLLALAALSGALALNVHTYHRFTDERPIAEVRFTALGPQRYQAQLLHPQGQAEIFELRGQQWQLDARLLKWHGLGTLLGLDAVYRLERLSGRYADPAAERQAPRTVYSLQEERGLDLWTLARRHPRWFPWVDAVYGSATYMPMADAAHYAVSVSPAGLIARPINPAAERAVAGWR